MEDVWEERADFEGPDSKDDQNGYFKVSLDRDGGDIIAEHYSTGGRLLNRIRGRSAGGIAKRAISMGLVMDIGHAAYLASELRAAQFALENGLFYEQDRALPKASATVPNTGLHAEATYVKSGKLISIPDKNNDERIRVGEAEMSFKEFLKSRGLSRVF